MADGIDQSSAGNNGDGSQSPLYLSNRERQVVAAVIRGLSNREIAIELGLSEQTIKNVLSAVYMKVGVHSRVQLATFAVRHNLVGP